MAVADKNTVSAETKTRLEQAHALFHQDKYAEAAPLYRELLKSHDSDFLVWGNLGICLRQMNHYHAALVCLQRANELQPNNPAILRHCANYLCLLGREEECLRTFEIVMRLQPNDFNNRLYYAAALCEFNRNEEAIVQFDAACAMEPKHLEAKWHRTDSYLRLGRFTEGWRDFELRWQLDKRYPYWFLAEQEKTYASRRWTGEDLTGKTILIYEEQGFGDTIFCSRYIPLVKARGAKVIVRCRPDLHRLFRTLPQADAVVGPADAHDRADYHVPIMSLPGLFGTDLSSIPPVPALQTPTEAPAAAQKLLDLAKDRLKVGIVWSGSPTYFANNKRAVSFARFLPLAETPNVQLFSLQKGPPEKELAASGAAGAVPELGPHLKDFADTTAVLKQLDLVIMTDSSVAHLAGSLNVPVWNLLSQRTYWIYFMQREDSPWYPSMRLFRQPAPGDWDSVFARVAAEFGKYAISKGH